MGSGYHAHVTPFHAVPPFTSRTLFERREREWGHTLQLLAKKKKQNERKHHNSHVMSQEKVAARTPLKKKLKK